MARAKGGFNVIAMLVAFGTIGGFLYWLSITAVPTETAVADEEVTAQAVSLALFARSPNIYEGDLVAVDAVEVQSVAYAQLFFLAFPGDGTYPVRVDASLGAAGASISPMDMGRVTGTVYALTDSVLDSWAADSGFPDDATREAAAASSTFILATELDLASAAAPEGEEGGA